MQAMSDQENSNHEEEEYEEEVKPPPKKKKKKPEASPPPQETKRKKKAQSISEHFMASVPDVRYHQQIQPQMFYSQPQHLPPPVHQMYQPIYSMPQFQQGPSQRSRLDAMGNLLKMTLQSKCIELNVPSGNLNVEYSIDEKVKITKLTVTATITENKDK